MNDSMDAKQKKSEAAMAAHTQVQSAGDIRCATVVLAARIDQKHRLRGHCAALASLGAIVDDCAIGACQARAHRDVTPFRCITLVCGRKNTLKVVQQSIDSRVAWICQGGQMKNRVMQALTQQLTWTVSQSALLTIQPTERNVMNKRYVVSCNSLTA
eukprot:scaffold306507_cov47-Prasinocladus_malaysianus.AAC.4